MQEGPPKTIQDEKRRIHPKQAVQLEDIAKNLKAHIWVRSNKENSIVVMHAVPSDLACLTIRILWRGGETLRHFFCDCSALAGARLPTLGKQFFKNPKHTSCCKVGGCYPILYSHALPNAVMDFEASKRCTIVLLRLIGAAFTSICN